MSRATAKAGYDAWFREQVQIGIDSANAGNLVDADEVEAEAKKWRAETKRKMMDPMR